MHRGALTDRHQPAVRKALNRGPEAFSLEIRLRACTHFGIQNACTAKYRSLSESCFCLNMYRT